MGLLYGSQIWHHQLIPIPVTYNRYQNPCWSLAGNLWHPGLTFTSPIFFLQQTNFFVNDLCIVFLLDEGEEMTSGSEGKMSIAPLMMECSGNKVWFGHGGQVELWWKSDASVPWWSGLGRYQKYISRNQLEVTLLGPGTWCWSRIGL